MIDIQSIYENLSIILPKYRWVIVITCCVILALIVKIRIK
jgi:hypothetical protein